MTSPNSPTNASVEQAIIALVTDEPFRQKVESLKDEPEALKALLKERGYSFTPEEWKAGIEKATPGELPEELLARVAGGVTLQPR